MEVLQMREVCCKDETFSCGALNIGKALSSQAGTYHVKDTIHFTRVGQERQTLRNPCNHWSDLLQPDAQSDL